jgi:regulator of replication initiation timing
MTQTDALQRALGRFGTAFDNLERFLGQLLEERDQAAKLKEQLRALTDERNRLASERDRLAEELDHESARARRLEDANSEVSGRLESVMGTLREMATAKEAEL